MTVLVHMPPSFASQDALDLRLLYTKARRDLALCKRALKTLDLCDLGIGQLGASVQCAFARNAKTVGVGVKSVLGSRNPFEIVSAIVRLAAVDVIDLVPLRGRRTEKRLCDQTMNRSPRLSRFKAQSDPQIAIRHSVGSKDALTYASRPLRAISTNFPAPPRYRPDLPEVRHFVGRLKSDNGPPNFAHHNLRYSLPHTMFNGAMKPIEQGEDR